MLHFRLRPSEMLLSLSLALTVACGKKDAHEGPGVTTVPRPTEEGTGARGDGGTGSQASPKPEFCQDGADCKGAASCVGTCGVHQLGDTNCSCQSGSLNCTECAYGPALQGMAKDATIFCAEDVDDDVECSTKGDTCILVDPDEQSRWSCLCWKAKRGLAWSCIEGPAKGLFADHAPPTPPPSDGGGDPNDPLPPPSGRPDAAIVD